MPTKHARRTFVKNILKKNLKTPKKSISVSQQLRDWGLPESYIRSGKTALRYRNPIEKGVYWYWFSKLRKLQDFITYGVCISCGRTIYELNSDAQAGHYYPASNCGFALLFHRKNVNLECSGCNGFDEGHLIGYGINLKIRYGEEIELELLQLRHKPQKEWSRLEYVQKIEEIRKEYDMLLSTSNL